MKADCVVPIKLTIDEKRYALALSKRLPNCPRPHIGSIAHSLKHLLRKQAKYENIPINKN